jgi:hypothetical protein
MQIVDKTPYRTEAGEIDLMGRIQGTLKYGLSWYSRVKAQDVVIAIIEKQLDGNYALLRNVTLPNTEITLPLVLIGPPGVYLINVMHERGVFIARDDQWGKMIGDRFVPARINQISRTQTFGRVLQVYLDRQGFKGSVVVESILMASDPGMQIESTRPAVRVVMSDALERFAASMNQARPSLNSPLAHDVAHAILVGRAPRVAAPAPATPVEDEETYTPSYGAYAFDEQQNEPEPQETKAPNRSDWREARADDSQPAKPQTKAKKPVSKKKGPLGLTSTQLLIVIAVLLFALCVIAAAAIFVLTNLNNG